MIRHLTIYAYASPESLREVAEKAGMCVVATDMFRHAVEWELKVAVDITDGTVKAAELTSLYGSLDDFPETKPTWCKLWGKKGDHHFFRDAATGQIAIADNSMRNFRDPTTTDDGVLWVRTDKPLRISSDGARTSIDISVTDKDGESYRCALSAKAAKFCVNHLDMKVEFL